MNVLGVPGVRIDSLTTHVDDRGYLFEALHGDDPWFTKFGQAYVIGSRGIGTIRGLHRHRHLTDWFVVLKGSAKFVLVEGNPIPFGEADRAIFRDFPLAHDTVTLSDRAPAVLTIPPMVWHGIMALDHEVLILGVIDKRHDPANPDAERVSHNRFNYLFGGDPWRVVPK